MCDKITENASRTPISGIEKPIFASTKKRRKLSPGVINSFPVTNAI